MSDQEYCTRRQMAWEMAFPNNPQSTDDRDRFVKSCVETFAKAPEPERARSRKCMEQHLLGHGHAQDQYVAFTTCEGPDPTRLR